MKQNPEGLSEAKWVLQGAAHNQFTVIIPGYNKIVAVSADGTRTIVFP